MRLHAGRSSLKVAREGEAAPARETAARKPGRPLALSTRLYYGIGAVAYGVKDNGFSFFLLLYYNQVLGLPERWVGLGIMIALVLDAVSDPIVGHLSDHLHSRWGRRHPFMYAAVLPVAVSYFLLWNPPAGLAGGSLLLYFVVLAILVRTFITFYEIPSTALVAELTDDYDERTAMIGYRYFFGWWGGLSMAVLAYAVFLQPDAAHPVGVLNPAGYRHYGLAASLIIVAAILVSAIGTHRHIPHLKQPPPKRPFAPRRAVRELVETLSNRSFLALFLAGLFAAMATGLTSSVQIYFATYFWELTANELSILALGGFVSAALALAAAPRISTRFGKKRGAISIATLAIVGAPAPIVLRLLDLFPANHSPALLPLLLCFNVFTVTLVIVAAILISSMIADVVEDSETVTGRRSEGVFFAASSFVGKSVSGVGVFLSTILLASVGFPTGARPGEVDPQVIRDLGTVYAPMLMVLYGAFLACLFGYRISRERHEENLRRLGARS